MQPLVTVGIPIYKRLKYLPNALRSVAAQEYSRIELLVSDNGLHGAELEDLVAANYSRPFRIRSNPASVGSAAHFNQIIAAATGKYFVLLADDDEITSNFVSELVPGLEATSEASFAIGRVDIMDENGETIRGSSQSIPRNIPGPEFLRAAWGTHEYGFECLVTLLARTDILRRTGGFPDFTGATHDDDAVLLRLCLSGSAVCSGDCAFRWRVYDDSMGWSLDIEDLAAASREFLRFLDEDSTCLEFARSNPVVWGEIRNIIRRMTFATYYSRWLRVYRSRMRPVPWVRAAFSMPFSRRYYGRVMRVLSRSLLRMTRTGLRRPWAPRSSRPPSEKVR